MRLAVLDHLRDDRLQGDGAHVPRLDEDPEAEPHAVQVDGGVGVVEALLEGVHLEVRLGLGLDRF